MLGFLEKYEFLATWIELCFFVGVFIFFELRRYIKERENDILEKTKAIISRIYEFLLVYLGDKYLDDKKVKNRSISKKQIPSFLKKISAEYEILKTLPKEFYDDIFFGTLFFKHKKITIENLANIILFLQGRNFMYNKGQYIIFKSFFQIVRKHFKNDKEIDKLYNNLLNK